MNYIYSISYGVSNLEPASYTYFFSRGESKLKPASCIYSLSHGVSKLELTMIKMWQRKGNLSMNVFYAYAHKLAFVSEIIRLLTKKSKQIKSI